MKNIFLVLALIFFTCANASQDPLPSWREGKIKHAIIEFVKTVSDEKSKDYVPPGDRFATIDNDGTLWVEQPMYTQMIFMNDRYQEIADKQPQYKSPGDWLRNKEDMEDVYAVTSTAISIDDYKNIVKRWLANATHPRYHRHYTELVYQPMLEVMDYLRENDFQVYIVSGSGQDFIRSYSESAYGVKPNFVIGSTSKTEYIYQGKKPTLIKIPKLLFIDDKDGKPQAIHLFIGKKPLIAFGNSDGDRQMLEWTQSGEGKRLMLLVRHDDAKREYAYDVNSKIGHLSQALLQEAKKNNWHIISMKKEWEVIFPFERKSK